MIQQFMAKGADNQMKGVNQPHVSSSLPYCLYGSHGHGRESFLIYGQEVRVTKLCVDCFELQLLNINFYIHVVTYTI